LRLARTHVRWAPGSGFINNKKALTPGSPAPRYHGEGDMGATTKMAGVVLAALVLAAAAGDAGAQSWPSKPIRVVVGFAPGGPTDILARTVADYLTQVLPQPAVVENKPGAASNVAAETVAKATPDGHTLLVGGMGPYAINVALYPALPYDPDKDFAPITVVGRGPTALAIANATSVDSLKEFVAYAKKNPGKINHSSPGVGTQPHLLTELFRMKAGFESTHAPYRSGPAALNAVVQGEVQWAFDALLTTLPAHHSGKVKVVAISSAVRWPAQPDIPTMAELGYPEATTYAWFALAAPGATPKEIIDRLNEEVTRGLRSEPIRTRLESLGLEPAPMTPAETVKWIADERARWVPVIKANNIRAE
jgi:tripartite-type tricarboxylate transporter receptor subunit TctC